MKLRFITPENPDRNLRATAHKNGKLGFSIAAARKMRLAVGYSAAVAINEDDPTDNHLYVIVYPGLKDDNFKISKAGDYYYLNAKPLFDQLNIDYKNESVVYDISEDIVNRVNVFKFSRRANTSF